MSCRSLPVVQLVEGAGKEAAKEKHVKFTAASLAERYDAQFSSSVGPMAEAKIDLPPLGNEEEKK